jgi:heme-degrading monooxygenase HmoA
MYLRLTRAHYNPARYEDIVSLASQVNAAVERLPGCQAMYQGTDRTTGTTAAVSIWDTEEHARFSRDALGDVIGRLQALGVQLDSPEFFEIVR